MANISERLLTLRTKMAEQKIDAWVITSSDPHQSEYVADHWSGRAWCSGFSGSAGTLIVLKTQAGLWTDGRYFAQAEKELEGSCITLMKEGHTDTPSIDTWLHSNLDEQNTIGFDGKTISAARVRRLIESLESKPLQILSDHDLLNTVWADRPAMPKEPVYLHGAEFVGRTCEEKFEQVRLAMSEEGVDHLLISSLDDIAWLLNLRGSDIECNPVFLAYLIVSKEDVRLYINSSRIEADAREALNSFGVKLRAYSAIASDLELLPTDSRIQLDPETTSHWLLGSLPESIDITETVSPISLLKAVKNDVEIASMMNCHRRDGVAIVRFMRWLESVIPAGNITEVDLDEHLETFRAHSSYFKGPSFPTIAGYRSNGAICHYRAEKASCLKIKPKGLLLVDSGGQYPDGTTDITRTFACGEITDEEKYDYTIVLKSHINLAQAKFKKGTRGIQLDMLARQPLWKLGMDYSHGTGHGVGYFLNVHEGPQNISLRWQDVPLKPGMLVTNEPGMYRTNKHGIRIENIMLVVEDVKTEFGQFYKLESLTLAPIDTKPLVMKLLQSEEIEWLNQYHAKVNNALSSLLDGDDLAWLTQATRAI